MPAPCSAGGLPNPVVGDPQGAGVGDPQGAVVALRGRAR